MSSLTAFALAVNHESNVSPNVTFSPFSRIFFTNCEKCGEITSLSYPYTLCVDNSHQIRSSVALGVDIKHCVEICCGRCDNVVCFCHDCLQDCVPEITDSKGKWLCNICNEETELSYQNLNCQLLTKEIYRQRHRNDKKRALVNLRLIWLRLKAIVCIKRFVAGFKARYYLGVGMKRAREHFYCASSQIKRHSQLFE